MNCQRPLTIGERIYTMPFRVEKVHGPSDYLKMNDHYELSADMRYEYGLQHLTPGEIMRIWENFSFILDKEWMIPTPSAVERAFNVTLVETGNYI